MSLTTIVLPGDGTDWDTWRDHARGLFAQGIAPHQVLWWTEHAQAHSTDLFSASTAPTPLPVHIPMQPRASVPATWPALAQQVLLHSSPARFDLLYRLLWRMQHEPGLKHDPLDADQVQLQHWLKAVRRDRHHMQAYVRFRPVALPDDPNDGQGPLHVAWYEPAHHITLANAPFFVHRFANMRWAILTPAISLRWWPQAPNVSALAAYGIPASQALQPWAERAGVLSWSVGANRSEAPAPDAGEALWLTYYSHTFNPARLKLATMARSMPRKYWHNLPEAQLISPLAQQALARSYQMLQAQQRA